MSAPVDLAQELHSFCNRLDSDFDAVSSFLDKDVSFRDKFTAVISRYMDQPRTASDFEPNPEPTHAATAVSPCKCDGEAGSGSDGNVPSRLPAASVEADPGAVRGASPKRKFVEADGAAAPTKRMKDSRAGRIPPIVAKMEKIGSPETLVRLWASCRASRTRVQSIVSGTRQILPVEPGRDMDGPSVLERLDSLKEQAAAASSSVHFSIAIKRFHHVQMVHLYNRARDLDETIVEAIEQGSASQSLVDQFAERLFSSDASAVKQAGRGADLKRKPLKSAFNRWLTLGNKLTTLVARYGCGVLLLLPGNLKNEDIRRLRDDDLLAVLDRMDARLRLKDSVQALTELLPSLATWGILPEPRIGLETCASASQVLTLASEPMFLESLLSWCAGAVSDAELALLTQPACHPAIEKHGNTADVNDLSFHAD
ncbi:hypothetical protein CORC01_14492 [Colletotrichum orchidophilum]|uniref:Uncharacterized protein n=1 Tax=Colletotrichum orchidophilum TaxID=1209926 RepID=A0A1G4AM17_9PEZI|nr:uncharacterized protein CORC01_14492 [Colletotrichum orchidophilum]OHE90214.1 hypothetical protein CORC01_14492 [Colletotrichum orchidophilum]